MPSEDLMWNAPEWLKANYRENNGLPLFFVNGDYSYRNRTKALDDYVITVTLAKSSDDPSYAKWADAIINDNFSILTNTSVNDYWNGLLEHENRQRTINNYQKIVFINSDSSSSQYNTPVTQGSKRKRSSEHAAPPPRPKIVINEIDGIFVSGLSSSIGSFIGTLANNSQITDRKSRYFVTLGMNGILDMTDETPGSQLSQLSVEAAQSCRNKFKPIFKTINTDVIEKYEELLQYSEKDYKKYLRKTLERVKYSRIADQDDIVRDVYQYILNLHLYSPEIFTNKTRLFLSEQDYVIKFWSYLIETVFRSSGVMPHWGDTISSFTISNGSMARMDLRLINFTTDDLKEALDVCNAEFAKKETESKYYKDLLKSVLSSKIHLNELFKDFPHMTQERIKEVKMPFCVVAGTTCYVYDLCLVSHNLYLVEDVCSMTIPLTLKDLKKGGVYDLLKDLLTLKEVCLDTKAVVDEKDSLLKERKIPVIMKNKKKHSNATRKDNTVNWCKDLWLPPPMSDDDDEDDDIF